MKMKKKKKYVEVTLIHGGVEEEEQSKSFLPLSLLSLLLLLLVLLVLLLRVIDGSMASVSFRFLDSNGGLHSNLGFGRLVVYGLAGFSFLFSFLLD